MNKKIIITSVGILMILAFLSARFLFGGDEDTWICTDTGWVKHGSPANPPPQTECGQRLQNTGPENAVTPPVATAETIIEAITEGFATKYNRPAEDFIVSTASVTETHARGFVEFEGEPGRGIWFGTKTQNGWELVFDGNGLMGCDMALRYGFPEDMVPQCLDTTKDDPLITR